MGSLKEKQKHAKIFVSTKVESDSESFENSVSLIIFIELYFY